MVQPPTGTVTLVFTDIQGSTALWEYFREDFKALLALHNTLFRAAIAEFGGYEVKTEGDAFMVAFSEAGSAVAMCLAMQERLDAAEWPETLNDEAVSDFAGTTEDGLFCGLRVRMGVHAGTPDCQPDPVTGRMDYFGRMVNRAARVGGVGHGGQLVVSEATWEALGADGTPAGTAVEDLGEHALKGLERREHLRQLLPASLAERSFPRLKTPNLKKTNLPSHLDSFFGREEEMVDLEQRVKAGQRLITLLGAGGTGKTRLSQRFGAKVLSDFPGGVWFGDLTEARTKAGILGAMSTALDVPLTSKDPEAQLADAILGHGRALIILDNFEQVVDFATETVARWLQRAPEAVFLVTSRGLLRIAGEETLYLDPLPVSEAVSLFFERARTAQPGFVRTAENEPVVCEIVEHLDCMSLAVELAAARVRMLSPEKILSRLSQRFKLLRGQRRDHTARQATLRGAIDWSWELLKAHERSALAQLSVFHGGCTLEAAEAVVQLDDCADEVWVLDVVEALVDHSLLRRVEPHVGHVRYRMLESIRQYAAEKLGEETAATALRHGLHFASFGEEEFLESLGSFGGVELCKDLALDFDNLLTGVDEGLASGELELAAGCVLAAGELFYLRGPFADGIALIERVPPVRQARLSCLAGTLMFVAGRLTEAVECFQQSLAVAREEGELLTEGITLDNLGHVDRERGRPSEGREAYHQALAIHREVGNRRREAITLGHLASVAREQGNPSAAMERCQQALAVAREVGDRRNESILLGNLAGIQHEQGCIPEALEQYHQALAIHRQVGDHRLEGGILSNLGRLHYDQGRVAEARENYLQALSIHRQVGNRRFEGITLGNLANLHQEQGCIPEALEQYHQALSINREVGARPSEGIILGNLGDLLFEQGDLAAAETHLRQAISISDEGRPSAAGAFRGSLALLLAQQGAFDEARTLLVTGEAQVRGVYALELGKLLCKKARVEKLADDPASATTALAEAESIASELNVAPDSELGKAVAEARTLLG